MTTRSPLDPLSAPSAADVEASLWEWMPKEGVVESLNALRSSERLRHEAMFFEPDDDRLAWVVGVRRSV